MGFLCGGETWTRVGPSDSEQPFQQHGQGSAEGDQRNKDDRPARSTGPTENRCASGAPKTTGSTGPKTAAPGQKTAAASGDVVGDICLLPDIARLAH